MALWVLVVVLVAFQPAYGHMDGELQPLADPAPAEGLKTHDDPLTVAGYDLEARRASQDDIQENSPLREAGDAGSVGEGRTEGPSNDRKGDAEEDLPHWNKKTMSWQCLSLNGCKEQPNVAEAKAEKAVVDLMAKEVSQKNHIADLEAESENTLKAVQRAKAAAQGYKTQGSNGLLPSSSLIQTAWGQGSLVPWKCSRMGNSVLGVPGANWGTTVMKGTKTYTPNDEHEDAFVHYINSYTTWDDGGYYHGASSCCELSLSWGLYVPNVNSIPTGQTTLLQVTNEGGTGSYETELSNTCPSSTTTLCDQWSRQMSAFLGSTLNYEAGQAVVEVTLNNYWSTCK
jgi:hypothetical protein